MKSSSLVLVLLLAGCAARGPSREGLAAAEQLNRADALVAAGCHACLVEALAAFERLAASPHIARDRIARATFDAALVLATRQKELGLPADAALAKAESAGALLPAAETSPMLAAARAWPGDTSAMDNDERQALTRAFGRSMNAEDRPLERGLESVTPPRLAVSYLHLTITCGLRRGPTIDADAVRKQHNDAPLVRYRLASCVRDAADLFATLPAADARWASEVDFFSTTGSMLTGNVRVAREAAARLTRASQAFPESGAIRLTLAGVQRSLRELDDALTSYNTVLGLVPTQREALLGRVITLTYLQRPDEAIEAATRLLTLGTWYLGDAHYWRAWNRYQRKELDAAWDDVERATTLLANGNVFTLAGLVAYGRRDLESARDRFERAIGMDRGNCEASSYLGIVHAEQGTWRRAAEAFAAAVTCFRNTVRTTHADLDALMTSDQPEDFKARQAAEFRTIIADAERQGAMAAYNAGNAHARAGDVSTALSFLEAAAGHPSMKEKADALRDIIRKR